MTAKHRPCLRSHVRHAQDPRDPDHVYLVDVLGLAPNPVRLSPIEYVYLDYFDGEKTILEIHQAVLRDTGIALPSPEHLHLLIDRLESHLFLDCPRFRGIIEHPIRPPRCIGCYEGDPQALREQLTDLFERGSGLPGPRRDSSLRAVLVPHIDYPRGGVTYTWGFKELAERTDASLFVVIGTSHHSRERFTLTRKDFQTPLGVVPTDQTFIDRLVREYGDGLFDDELQAHLPEHSIELEVVFLQYLFEKKKPIRIVPLVVGSFHDCVQHGLEPRHHPQIKRMIDALAHVEAQTKEPICHVISGDLAHIGPKFNARESLTADVLRQSKSQDELLLRHAEALRPDLYFDVIAREQDRRNICGLPPTYLTLVACQPRSGKSLAYDRYVHPRGHESVSFASVAFYR